MTQALTNPIRSQLKRTEQSILAQFQELLLSLQALPENPRTRRLPGGVNAFIIRSKDLGKSWGVDHHDFNQQYKYIETILKKTDPLHIRRKLAQIIRTKKIKDPAVTGASIFSLHPDVAKILRKWFYGSHSGQA